MEFNAHEAAQRLSNNVDFINLMRAFCKISGWNTVLPDRSTVVTKTSVNGKVTKEVVTQEVVSTDILMKYNGKREVWHDIRTLLNLSAETMARIEYGIQKGENVK